MYLRCTSRYSHAIFFSMAVKVMLLWPASHIFTVVCSKMCCFKFFNSCKMLKMLKIGWFKQNYCVWGMPRGIPMQFFAQQRWKSCCCDQFYTYSQWFAAKVVVLNFSIAAKFSKCLKWADLSKITVSQVCLKVFPCNFLLNSAESHVVVYQFYTYSQWFAAKFVVLNFYLA